MQFVNVVGDNTKPRPNRPDYHRPVIHQLQNALYSLISGVKQKEFGYDTLMGVHNRIRKYKNEYLKIYGNSKLFIDSSGYSYIKGEINPRRVSILIDAYHLYVRSAINDYDYIFSLDLPFTIEERYERYNTIEYIEKLNRISLERSTELLQSMPGLSDKWVFIWQFKIQGQFMIWKKLYEDLELNKLVKNRAIGGLVSVRKHAKETINYSILIPMAFRNFLDYLTAQNFSHPFRLHLLGVGSVVYDRLAILVLENLFQRYLGDQAKAFLSFDSISYSQFARKKAKSFPTFSFNGNTLARYPEIFDIPDSVLRNIYTTSLFDYYDDVKAEIDRLRNGNAYKDGDAMIPLNVFSQLEIDRYMEYFLKKHAIIDVIFECKGLTEFRYHMKDILQSAMQECPSLFTKDMSTAIMNNMSITYNRHRWFMDQRDYPSIDKDIEFFLQEAVKFPGQIK